MIFRKILSRRLMVLSLLVLGAVIGFGFLPSDAMAQSINIDLGGDERGQTTSRILQVIALITILSIAPSILVMVTSFTRIVVVLSFVRSALGLQQTPPHMVLVSLAVFLSAFIMAPTFQQAYDNGIRPLINEQISEEAAMTEVINPFRQFMFTHVRDRDLQLFVDMSGAENVTSPEDVPTQALIPAFMISELRRAFEIGFLLFLPFLIIDLVIASILMSMGMMMLPPVMISLPFKIIFFVLVDGWYMLAGSLVQGFGVGL